ncbi:hypothetical protein BGX29_010131 [Mortierella sp. GBA35]|nr:hypothetical protein BGX29_010131 [Mortierella sp. GBA35]
MFTLAETVGAMAVFTFFGPKDRGLVTNINVDYIKIARGVLTATATTPVIKDRTVKFATSEVIITDAKSDIVAKMSLTVRTDFRGE